MSMYFPNLEELSFRTVFAFPNAENSAMILILKFINYLVKKDQTILIFTSEFLKILLSFQWTIEA